MKLKAIFDEFCVNIWPLRAIWIEIASNGALDLFLIGMKLKDLNFKNFHKKFLFLNVQLKFKLVSYFLLITFKY